MQADCVRGGFRLARYSANILWSEARRRTRRPLGCATVPNRMRPPAAIKSMKTKHLMVSNATIPKSPRANIRTCGAAAAKLAMRNGFVGWARIGSSRNRIPNATKNAYNTRAGIPPSYAPWPAIPIPQFVEASPTTSRTIVIPTVSGLPSQISLGIGSDAKNINVLSGFGAIRPSSTNRSASNE